MHKVFISYHHHNDQEYKDSLVKFGKQHSIFVDRSVDTGNIPDEWSDETIRQEIRDNYLRDSTVTIVLVGKETRQRKHVDWEIYSSMYDGTVNKKSGILVINLPGFSDGECHAAYGDEEKKIVHPEITSWMHVDTRAEYERRYPRMPDRIIDNLIKSGVKISVIPWAKVRVEPLTFLIDAAFEHRANCRYDLSTPMRRHNS